MEFDRVDLDQGLPTADGLAQTYIDRRYPPGDPEPTRAMCWGSASMLALAVHRGPKRSGVACTVWICALAIPSAESSMTAGCADFPGRPWNGQWSGQRGRQRGRWCMATGTVKPKPTRTTGRSPRSRKAPRGKSQGDARAGQRDPGLQMRRHARKRFPRRTRAGRQRYSGQARTRGRKVFGIGQGTGGGLQCVKGPTSAQPRGVGRTEVRLGQARDPARSAVAVSARAPASARPPWLRW